MNAIDKDASVNRDNVINKIKEVLQREDTVAYQEWENKNFDVNHIFIESDSSAKFTLLIVAAAKSYKNMVNALLERDADIYVEDENKEVALHYAVYGTSTEIINALLDRGANINAENKDIWTFYI
ncbi:MAG: ankyrin repeat domain-containing protein [Wolbachia sp.]